MHGILGNFCIFLGQFKDNRYYLPGKTLIVRGSAPSIEETGYTDS